MRPVTDINEIHVGMVLENRCRGTVTVTAITEDGWIRYTYMGLLGPGFKEQQEFENADRISYYDEGVTDYPFWVS